MALYKTMSRFHVQRFSELSTGTVEYNDNDEDVVCMCVCVCVCANKQFSETSALIRLIKNEQLNFSYFIQQNKLFNDSVPYASPEN